MSIDERVLGPEEREDKISKAREDLAKEDLVLWHLNLGQSFLKGDEEPKPVEWMVDGFITYDGITLYSAKAKLGKSSLICDLAIAAASGLGSIRTPEGGWLFDFKGQRVKTYYLDTENSRGTVNRRFESLAKEKGLSRKELFDSGWLMVMPLELKHPPPFLNPKRQKLEDDLLTAKEFGAVLKESGVKLIILDVLSHCYPEDNLGRDENDRGFIADFYKVISAIRTAANASILIVHHHRKGPSDQGNESASGSGQLLRTPTTLISVSILPESKNPNGDLYQILIEGRETRGARKILKARSTLDGVCRAFDQVEEPVVEKRPPGRQAGEAKRIAGEILDSVLLKDPDLVSRQIRPKDWFQLVQRVNGTVPEWQKSEATLKGYLTKELVESLRVEVIDKAQGLYRVIK